MTERTHIEVKQDLIEEFDLNYSPNDSGLRNVVIDELINLYGSDFVLRQLIRYLSDDIALEAMEDIHHQTSQN